MIYRIEEEQWTRSQPIRTAAELQAHIKILSVKHPYLYQKLAKKATQLRLLGMSYTKIGKTLGIDHKTVAKAIRRLRHCEEQAKPPHRHCEERSDEAI